MSRRVPRMEQDMFTISVHLEYITSSRNLFWEEFMLSSCIRVKRVILRIEVFVVSPRFVLYLYLFDYFFFIVHGYWCVWLVSSFCSYSVTYRALMSPPKKVSLVWFMFLSQSLTFCGMFCGPLFVVFVPFCWPLCCLSFFGLSLLIINLVSSNFSDNLIWVWGEAGHFYLHVSFVHLTASVM